MDHRVTSNGGAEVIKLGLGWRFAIQQNVTNFEIVRVGSQLINRETTMEQNAFVTVNVGNLGFTGRSRSKTRIVGE